MLNGAGTRVDLSPAKQLLLKKRLQGQAVRTAQDSVIPRCERSGRAPLSFAQQRLWFLDQLAPGSPVYNISEGMHLVGPLDVPALGQSLKEIVHFYNTRDVYAQPVLSGNCPAGTVEKVTCWPMPEDPNNENMTIGHLGLSSNEEDDLVAFLQTL